ncbi:MAG: ATP-binding protein [Clostridium sp.]
MDDNTMKRAVKMLLMGLIIYILWCTINAGTESTIFYQFLNEHNLVMSNYIVFAIFVMIQFVVIILFVRSLKSNKKIYKSLNEKRILQEELICNANQLTELNKLKDRLFREVTHDIRGPMAAMVSMMEILNDDEDRSDNKEIIYEVSKQVKSTFFMVDNLLERLNCQKGGLVYRDITNVAQETLNVLSGNNMAKGIRIMNNMEGVVTLFLEKEILGMVLCNIVNNAVKMARSGGLISIQTHQIERKVIVTIRDTGIGIGLDKAKTLFSQANIGFTEATVVKKATIPGILILKEFVQSGEIQRLMDSTTWKDNTFYLCLSSEEEANRI